MKRFASLSLLLFGVGAALLLPGCKQDGSGTGPDLLSAVDLGALDLTVDDDCANGVEAAFYFDGDGDGFGDPRSVVTACAAPSTWYVTASGDCDDENDTINPVGVEVCDGVDHNCDGVIEAGPMATFFLDSDGDGYGDPTTALDACGSPGVQYTTTGGDCDDADDAVNPLGVEICDGVDNDCDTGVDNGVGSVWYADVDNDGFGDPLTAHPSCTAPSGEVSLGTDCDDTDPDVNPTATEICNFVDDDCDAQTSEDGMVSFDDGTGLVDITSDFAAGSSGSPVAWTSATAGTLRMCAGTFYTTLALGSNVEVHGAGSDRTVINAGGQGAGLSTSGANVTVADLTITGGTGIYDPNLLETAGGGLLCSGGSVVADRIALTGNTARFGSGVAVGNGCALTLRNATVTGNAATYNGGGAVTVYLATAALQDVKISGNTGSGAYVVQGNLDVVRGIITGNLGSFGGLFVQQGSLTLVDSDVSDNAANYGGPGGVLLGQSTASITRTTLSRNVGDGYGGGLYLDSSHLDLVDSWVTRNFALWTGGIHVRNGGTVTCTANSVGSGGILGNSNDGVSLIDSRLDSNGCDFGTQYTVENNAPVDIRLLQGGTASYGNGQTFTCTDPGGCN